MADRTTFTGASVDVPWANTGMPEGIGDNQARHFKQLYDAAAFPLTSVGGTADDVTATLDPVLDSGGLVDGMKFSLTWDAENTGPMTLALNGGSPADVLGADGSVMIAGTAKAGARALLEYISGAFRIIGGGNSGGAVGPYFTQITASTTWNKPPGYSDDAVVEIEAWGAGGGGGQGSNGAGGGGGGGYVRRRLRYADVPSSLAIVIGAGGPGGFGGGNGGAGGDTTVGTLVTGPGGKGGVTNGAGGVGGSFTTFNTLWSGGIGGSSGASAGGATIFGGGGGGGGRQTGSPFFPGGTSLFGGNGGGGAQAGSVSSAAGTAPGGGGGGGSNSIGGAAGARGEARIWIWN